MTGAEGVLSRDRTAQFVSWTECTRYDPHTDTRKPGHKRGRYLGSTQQHWLLDINGTTTRLDKGKWTPCLK